MFRITLSLGGTVVRKYPFEKDSVTIGRDADCDISIDNVAVSRNHASITFTEGEYVLEDLQSGNGTFVNGEKVVTHVLQPGDAFVIGKYSLLFETVSDVESVVRESARKAGGDDATFRLDRKELEKLIGKAAKGEAKSSLIPEGGGNPVPLNRPWHFAGSSSDATIPASGPLVMPRIALFLKEEASYRLVRVGGKFGKVTVNQQDVDSRVLRVGDVIDICGKRYQFAQE
ncbi:MAG: FHA domain-containing protein [Planctomycetaceae bacterium]|nr:FHA domain-containing protein [Planctomycetota bacterium]NUN51930.1 FHA domain-containing protein [Planctomycetaceae bacterium]